MSKRPIFRPKGSWSDTFKRGFAAGIRVAEAHFAKQVGTPKLSNLATCKSLDRAACRAVEGRHCGNDNGIKGGYKTPY